MGSNANRGRPETVLWVSCIGCVTSSVLAPCVASLSLSWPWQLAWMSCADPRTYYYRDVLELKAIQRSLPTAAQLPDPLARRPHSQILKGVPIALLPLYDDNLPCNSVSKPPPTPIAELPPVPSRSPRHAPAIPSSLSSSSTPITASPTWSRTPTEPTRPFPPRSKPNFAFLPLLDAPTPSPQPPPPPPSSEVDTDDSDHDLSTPALSSASLDTTPSPRDDYSDSESYFQLPTRREGPASRPYHSSCPPTQKSASAGTPSPFSLNPPSSSVYFRSTGLKKPLQVRTEPPICFDINGETYHFGPASTPPGSPPLSPLSPTLHSPGSSSSSPPPPPQRYPPFFSDRGHDLQPSFSRSTARNPGSPKSPTRTKDFRSSSPILGPYCAAMKRGGGNGGGGSSPCSSPVLSPVRGGTTSRKGRLEH